MLQRLFKTVNAKTSSRWWTATGVIVSLIAVTGFSKTGVGIGGTSMTMLCHGGIFYFKTQKPELATGPFCHRDHFFYDWKPEIGKTGLIVEYAFIPLWPLPLLTAIGGGIARWREARFKPGHCQGCGYDIRGSSADKCPECGRASTA